MDRLSQKLFKTRREDPSGEVSINAKLLERAGFIDKLMAGSYTLMPLGRKVEKKIEQIIREEMDKTGAEEILMPLMHPKEVWNETGRWDSAKEVMYQFKKDDKEYALSFTHEEIVMDLLRKRISSYKDLPAKIYHFSTKFRNELRAKSGILRGREFLMKDLYSVHATEEDLKVYYEQIITAYKKIYERIGVDVLVAEASGGVFTDNHTHEFQLVCPAGEDTIYTAPDWKYAKNKEIMTEDDYNTQGLEEFSSVEVGNIFQLGQYYSQKMNVNFTDKDGVQKPVWFASYGIGVSRLIGSIVEVSHDEKGIIWPKAVAPYDVIVVDLANEPDKTSEVVEKLESSGQSVLLDDRDLSAGEKLADADLIGVPNRVVVSKRSLEQGGIAVKKRTSENEEVIPVEHLSSWIDKS